MNLPHMVKLVLEQATEQQNQLLAEGTPNALTAETIQKARRDVDVFKAKSAADLFNKLDI
jgi:hypothetical protein